EEVAGAAAGYRGEEEPVGEDREAAGPRRLRARPIGVGRGDLLAQELREGEAASGEAQGGRGHRGGVEDLGREVRITRCLLLGRRRRQGGRGLWRRGAGGRGGIRPRIVGAGGLGVGAGRDDRGRREVGRGLRLVEQPLQVLDERGDLLLEIALWFE